MANSYIPGLISAAAKWDLVGPTIDDDIRRLIGRYGGLAVKEATARMTKAKRGAKMLPDWKELKPWIDEDAKAWLEGRDYLTPEDLQAVYHETMAHRVFFSPIYEMRRGDVSRALMEQILQKISAP